MVQKDKRRKLRAALGTGALVVFSTASLSAGPLIVGADQHYKADVQKFVEGPVVYDTFDDCDSEGVRTDRIEEDGAYKEDWSDDCGNDGDCDCECGWAPDDCDQPDDLRDCVAVPADCEKPDDLRDCIAVPADCENPDDLRDCIAVPPDCGEPGDCAVPDDLDCDCLPGDCDPDDEPVECDPGDCGDCGAAECDCL